MLKVCALAAQLRDQEIAPNTDLGLGRGNVPFWTFWIYNTNWVHDLIQSIRFLSPQRVTECDFFHLELHSGYVVHVCTFPTSFTPLASTLTCFSLQTATIQSALVYRKKPKQFGHWETYIWANFQLSWAAAWTVTFGYWVLLCACITR